MISLAGLSVEELAEGICLRAGRIAAAQAELLAWVGEFDRREGWAGPGMLSCAHWLSWRVGLSPGAAREQVRVARRLPELPAVGAAFAAGRLSFSQVRAITRVAEPGDGIDWVGLGRYSSAAQLERIVRGVRRARAAERAVADPELAGWRYRLRRRFDADGNVVFLCTVPAEHAPLVEAGFEAARAALQRDLDAQPDVPAASRPGQDDAAGTPVAGPLPDVPAETPAAGPGPLPGPVPVPGPGPGPGPGLSPVPPAGADVPAGTPDRPRVTDAQALLALIEQALATEQAAQPDLARRRRPRLTVQIDPLSGWGRLRNGELLPPTSLNGLDGLARTLPDGDPSQHPKGRSGWLRRSFGLSGPRANAAADLRRHDLGRTQRTVSPRLRELLGTLDGERCRFPGCTRTSDLHAHHVRFWRHGGRTDLANLILVCPRHHTLIHTQDFRLTLHPDRHLHVRTSRDVPVLHHPAQPWGDPTTLATGTGRHVSAETLPPENTTSHVDLSYAITVLLAQAA